MEKIGQGTYGEVYAVSNEQVVKKIDKFDKHYTNTKGFELTSLCEIAILSLTDLHDYIPKIIEIKEDDLHFYVYMEDCGYNLAIFSKEYSEKTRFECIPNIALRLLHTSAMLREYELVHNDIKRPNVVINNDGKLKVIDFGLCMFDTIPYVDMNLVYNPSLNNNSCLTKEWGTYTIMPPEAFTNRIWHQDCLMSWSIGITICEFIFQTHTFIKDYVFNTEEKDSYKIMSGNDTTHKQFMKTFFEKKINNGDKYLFEFKQNDYMKSDIVDMLNSMLILDFTKRPNIDELMKSKCLQKFFSENFNKRLRQIRLHTMYFTVQKPLLNISYTIYMSNRKEVCEWMFDMLMICNKLGAFSFAVQLFDRYLSKSNVPCENYILLAAACLYIAQIKNKHTHIPINVITDSVSIMKSDKIISVDDVNDMILTVLRTFNFNIYMPSFDIMALKYNSSLDMKKVLTTHLKMIPPYNNVQLMHSYNSCK